MGDCQKYHLNDSTDIWRSAVSRRIQEMLHRWWCDGAEGENHCIKARRMSFTSMVPISIFSQLTVSWAAPSSLVATVTNTRLPLVTVLPANLWTGWSGGGTGGLRSKQQVESQEVTEAEIEGHARPWAGFKDNIFNSDSLRFYGNTNTTTWQAGWRDIRRWAAGPYSGPSHLHSLSEPQGTLLRLAAVVTLCTMACSLRHLASNVSFSAISFIPISWPAAEGGQRWKNRI